MYSMMIDPSYVRLILIIFVLIRKILIWIKWSIVMRKVVQSVFQFLPICLTLSFYLFETIIFDTLFGRPLNSRVNIMNHVLWSRNVTSHISFNFSQTGLRNTFWCRAKLSWSLIQLTHDSNVMISLVDLFCF